MCLSQRSPCMQAAILLSNGRSMVSMPAQINQLFKRGVLQNSNVVSCVLTPNDACISNSPLSSNAIVIGVNGLPQATMISKNAFCPGDTLAITSADSLSKIIWSETSTPVKTVTANPVGTCITVCRRERTGPRRQSAFFTYWRNRRRPGKPVYRRSEQQPGNEMGAGCHQRNFSHYYRA